MSAVAASSEQTESCQAIRNARRAGEFPICQDTGIRVGETASTPGERIVETAIPRQHEVGPAVIRPQQPAIHSAASASVRWTAARPVKHQHCAVGNRCTDVGFQARNTRVSQAGRDVGHGRHEDRYAPPRLPTATWSPYCSASSCSKWANAAAGAGEPLSLPNATCASQLCSWLHTS